MLSTKKLISYATKILNDVNNPAELSKTVNKLVLASLNVSERRILTVIWNYKISSLKEIKSYVPEITEKVILEILDNLREYNLIVFLTDPISETILYKKSNL